MLVVESLIKQAVQNSLKGQLSLEKQIHLCRFFKNLLLQIQDDVNTANLQILWVTAHLT